MSNPMLSKYFDYAKMTATSSGLPNLPPADVMGNLKKLAQTLDVLYDRIGPFRIISAFRSQDLQDLLRTQTNQAVARSGHTGGMAADIQPINGDLKAYMAKAYSDPVIRNLFGGFAMKNNTLHVELPMPEKNKATLIPMYVAASGEYMRFSPAQLNQILSDYASEIQAHLNRMAKQVQKSAEEAVQVVSENPIKSGLIGASLVGLVAFFILRGKK